MSIKETFEEFAYQSSTNGVKAFIANQLSLDDGVHTVDEIIESASGEEIEDAEIVCGDILDLLQDKYEFNDIIDELETFMTEHADEPLTAERSTSGTKANESEKSKKAGTATSAPAPAAQPATASTPASAAAYGSNIAANYPNFVEDDFEAAFSDWDEFKQCISDMDATETVYTHDEDLQTAGIGFDPIQPNLKVSPIANNPMFAASMAKSMNANPDAVLSSMSEKENAFGHGGTGLALQMGNSEVPIGWSAIGGMNERAGLKNDGFLRHWKKAPEMAAEAYNRQFENGKSGVTVIVRCHKVRGMMSKGFAYAKFTNILKAFETFWKQTFPNGSVQNMYVDHTGLNWELNLEAYKATIFSGFPDLMKSNQYPVLQFASSNTADAAFRIMPAIGMTGSRCVVPLCSPQKHTANGAVVIRHTAVGNFSERCDAIMQAIIDGFAESVTALDASSRDLQALFGVNVHNAYNAVLRVMAKEGIPKKQGMEAAENFKNAFGDQPTSAFNCFMAIVNAYSFFVRDNPNKPRKHFLVALAVGKIARAKWEAYDIPGDFSW